MPWRAPESRHVAAAVAATGAGAAAQLRVGRREQVHRGVVGHARVGDGRLGVPAVVRPLAAHVGDGLLTQREALRCGVEREAGRQAAEFHACTGTPVSGVQPCGRDGMTFTA